MIMIMIMVISAGKSRRPGLEAESDHVGFMVDISALGQAFSEYSCFPCQFCSTLIQGCAKWTHSASTHAKELSWPIGTNYQ
jgi:hypothetical protein